MKSRILMAPLLTTMMLLVLAGTLLATEYSVNVTSHAWLTDPESVKGPRVLLKFDLPEDFSGKTVSSAKLFLPVSFVINDSALANLSVWPLAGTWLLENVGWDTPWSQAGGDVADSSYILFPTDDVSSRLIEIEISGIVSAWAQEWYANNGLLVMLLQPESQSFQLEENAEWPSGAVARVEISYEE